MLKVLLKPVLDKAESLLVWINARQMADYSLFELIICEKERALNADLTKDNPSASNNSKTFHSSKGLVHNFKVSLEFII